MRFSQFDARGYRTVDVRSGYGEWVDTYEQTVQDAMDVELLGALPPVHTHVSGILVAPFVGILGRDPAFTPNAGEIAEVLEFPVARLAAVRETRWLEHDGSRFPTPVYELDGHVIWGATGRILDSFFEALAEKGGA